MLDAAAYPALWTLSDVTGIRPEWALPVLWIESGFRPDVPNLQGYPYYGINQISGSYLQKRGIDPQVYLTWPASQQLAQIVQGFWGGEEAQLGPFRSGTKLYLANFYPAAIRTPQQLGDQIVCAPSKAYLANAGLDVDKSGCITVQDLSLVVAKAAAQPSVQAAILKAYSLRPDENPRDPVFGDDIMPTPIPVPPTPSATSNPSMVPAVVGGVAIVGVATLVALSLRRMGARAHVRENPYRGAPWSKKKFDRCVRKVERRGGATNAYAVCTAQMNRSRR